MGAGCGGMATECEALATTSICVAQEGCQWLPEGEELAPATIKFCNTLSMDDMPIELTLNVTAGSTELSLSAITLECNTATGDPCLEIPAGETLTMELVDGTGLVLATSTVDAAAPGSALYVYTDYVLEASIETDVLEAPDTCDATDINYLLQ